MFGLGTLLFISLLANAQTETAPQESADLGSVTGSTYSNKYFGLTLTIPARWTVQNSSTKQLMSEKGKQLVTSNDANKQAELSRAVDATLNLLTVTQYPIGEAGRFNSMLICGAERVPAGVKSDADYLSALKNTLRYSQIPITIDRDVYLEQIGGTAFSVIDFKSTYPVGIVSQKYYAHLIKGYALFFILTSQTDEQLKTQTEILKSVILR